MNEIIKVQEEPALIKNKYQLLYLVENNYLGTWYVGVNKKNQWVSILLLNSMFSEIARKKYLKLKKVIYLCHKLSPFSLIRLKDIAEYKGQVCLIQDYFYSVTLNSYILHAKKSFNTKSLLEIMYPVVYFLRFIHRHKLSHGAIRSDQLLINEDFEVKIRGFKWESILLEDFKKNKIQALLIPEEVRYFFKHSSDTYAVYQVFLELLSKTNKKFFLLYNRSKCFYQYVRKTIEPNLLNEIEYLHKHRKCKNLEVFFRLLLNAQLLE